MLNLSFDSKGYILKINTFYVLDYLTSLLRFCKEELTIIMRPLHFLLLPVHFVVPFIQKFSQLLQSVGIDQLLHVISINKLRAYTSLELY